MNNRSVFYWWNDKTSVFLPWQHAERADLNKENDLYTKIKSNRGQTDLGCVNIAVLLPVQKFKSRTQCSLIIAILCECEGSG